MTTPRIRELEALLRQERKAEREKKGKRLGHVQRKGRGCRDRDEDLKRQRGYSDPSSFVRRDGSEVLKGADWKKRVAELRERSGGRCEQKEVYAMTAVASVTREYLRGGTVAS